MPEMRTAQTGEISVSVVENYIDPQTRTDYINRTNTRIMSGQGADIYALDILPVHKMINNNVFENLNPYMELDPDFNKNDYRQNILDAVRYQNSTWFFPLDYFINYYAYDSTLFPQEISQNFGIDKAFTIDDLIKITEPLFNGTEKLLDMNDYGLYNILFNENYRSFVNLETGRANFLDGKFTSLLNTVKRYNEQDFLMQPLLNRQSIEDIMQMLMQGMNLRSQERFYLKQHSDSNLLNIMSRDSESGLRMMGRITGSIDSDDEIAGIAANADGSVPFSFTRAFAINSKSRNKPAAWAFLKFLLSKEMQLSIATLGMGLPVHNEAREEKSEMFFTGAIFGMDSPMTDKMQSAYNEYRRIIEVLSDMINTYVYMDTNVNDMIAQEVQYFFDGSRTAEEVARLLQNKADLYLSE